MSNNLPKLTPEQAQLGQLYAWIRRRAEYLRQQAAQAAGQEDSRPAQNSQDDHKASKA